MRTTILAVLLLLCMIDPRTTKNVAAEQSEANTQNSQAPPCLSPPLIADVPAYVNQDQCQKETAEKQRGLVEISPSPLLIESGKNSWDKALVVATVFLVFVGGFQIWFLRETVYAARDNAKAALSNAQAVINSERAWMDIDLGAPEKDPDIDDDFGRYSIQIINRGRTVAHVERVEYGVNAASGAWNLEGFNTVNKKFTILLAQSDKPTTIITIDIPSRFSDWDSIRNETKIGFIRVAVVYRDVLKNSDLHETSAIYKWNARNEEPEREAFFNTYS
jgi:hypothetical protein